MPTAITWDSTGKVHKASDFHYFTDLSLWDTFRTAHPLYTLIAPQDQRDMLISLVKMLEQGGWLPRWPSGHGYSNSMLGTPADIVIADSYLKGIRDFDVAKAYQAMRRTALGPTPPGAAFSGREGVTEYLQYGYCPAGWSETASRGRWNTRGPTMLSLGSRKSLGHAEDAALFRKHAQSYRNVWNPETQYFQPRDAQGKFVEPFKPLLLTYFDRKGKYTKDYVEGSALQWRWGAPFDAEGLVSLFKSREYFVEELNSFFAEVRTRRWAPGIPGPTIGTATSPISTRLTCSTPPAGRTSPRNGCAGSWTISMAIATTAWTATTTAERSRPGTSSARSACIRWPARTSTNWARRFSRGRK